MGGHFLHDLLLHAHDGQPLHGMAPADRGLHQNGCSRLMRSTSDGSRCTAQRCLTCRAFAMSAGRCTCTIRAPPASCATGCKAAAGASSAACHHGMASAQSVLPCFHVM